MIETPPVNVNEVRKQYLMQFETGSLEFSLLVRSFPLNQTRASLNSKLQRP